MSTLQSVLKDAQVRKLPFRRANWRHSFMLEINAKGLIAIYGSSEFANSNNGGLNIDDINATDWYICELIGPNHQVGDIVVHGQTAYILANNGNWYSVANSPTSLNSEHFLKTYKV